MKSNQRSQSQPKDTPATRKRRLQARLSEISAKSEQELATLMQTIDKLKKTLRPESKPSSKNRTTGNTVKNQLND